MAVMINDGMYSLKIGDNSYTAGKMTPAELSFAPEIKNDLTYVPFEFFSDIMQFEWHVEAADDASSALSMSLTGQIAGE